MKVEFIHWIIIIVISLIITDISVDIIRTMIRKDKDEVKEFLAEMEKLRIKNLPKI